MCDDNSHALYFGVTLAKTLIPSLMLRSCILIYCWSVFSVWFRTYHKTRRIWHICLLKYTIQYRYVIPAPVHQTSASAWLHKHHIKENRPSNTGLKTFTGNCMHCFQLNYIHSKVSLTATVFILCFFDELICHYPCFPLSIHLLLLLQTDKLIFVFYHLYVI